MKTGSGWSVCRHGQHQQQPRIKLMPSRLSTDLHQLSCAAHLLRNCAPMPQGVGKSNYCVEGRQHRQKQHAVPVYPPLYVAPVDCEEVQPRRKCDAYAAEDQAWVPKMVFVSLCEPGGK